MVVCEINDYRNQHWERLVLVSLEDVEEVVVLEEAHGSIGNLKMDSANASDNSLEEFRDQMFNFVYFANFQDLLQLSQEQSFLNAVGERPVLEQPFQQRNCESSVLSEEEH